MSEPFTFEPTDPRATLPLRDAVRAVAHDAVVSDDGAYVAVPRLLNKYVGPPDPKMSRTHQETHHGIFTGHIHISWALLHYFPATEQEKLRILVGPDGKHRPIQVIRFATLMLWAHMGTPGMADDQFLADLTAPGRNLRFLQRFGGRYTYNRYGHPLTRPGTVPTPAEVLSTLDRLDGPHVIAAYIADNALRDFSDDQWLASIDEIVETNLEQSYSLRNTIIYGNADGTLEGEEADHG